MRTKEQYYHEARKAGMSAKHALSTAKTLVAWQEAEEAGLVRLRAEEEEENYFDSYGKPEAYTSIYGRRVSEGQATKELEDLLERKGCWCVLTEWFDGDEWHLADSVGMCVGYDDPCDWKQNWSVPDLMASALDEVAEEMSKRRYFSSMRECGCVGR